MNLRHTITPKGDFYFVNSRRVSRTKYENAKQGRGLDTFLTTTTKDGVIRQHCHVRTTK